MLSTGLVAIDATILATSVPSIVGDLGDFSQFPWLFSIYLLAQAVSVPVYAKLSDTVGRKPLILFGIGLFLAGSILCGLAWSMPALIAFRVIQGLGAGAVQPMAVTIAGDVYTVAERAKVQGYLASVWAISSVAGPALGGLFSEFFSWRLIFFVNVPLCILAGLMIMQRFHEKIEKRKHHIDYAGSIVLTIALSSLILAVLEGGQAWAWNSLYSFAAFGFGAVMLVVFVLVERRAAEPVLPLWVFSRRLLLTTTLMSLGVGAILLGVTSFVPTYLEGALHITPLISGLAVAAITLGWPIAASQSGRFYLTIGFKRTILIGLGIAVLGTLSLWLSAPTPNLLLVTVSCFIVGLGLGLVASPGLIAAQSSVPWEERGVVTGTNFFARSIGSAVGVAIFGAIANSIYASHAGGQNDPATIALATGSAFLAVLVCAVAIVVAAFAMPDARLQSDGTVALSPELGG
ncbi:MFS transporter [Subtercola lobariae]|nr:MFS transporter [Subtercola lobariae]